MKKKLFVIFLSMVFVLSLFGCGGSKGRWHHDYIKPSDFKEDIEENVIYTFKKGERTYYYKNVEREGEQIKFNQNSALWILNEFVMNIKVYGERLSSHTFSIDPLNQINIENSYMEGEEKGQYEYNINNYYSKTNGCSYSFENTSDTVVLVEKIDIAFISK